MSDWRQQQILEEEMLWHEEQELDKDNLIEEVEQ